MFIGSKAFDVTNVSYCQCPLKRIFQASQTLVFFFFASSSHHCLRFGCGDEAEQGTPGVQLPSLGKFWAAGSVIIVRILVNS